jgi:cyclophilin family peptidyl-prolyl cis-trans isomerase
MPNSRLWLPPGRASIMRVANYREDPEIMKHAYALSLLLALFTAAGPSAAQEPAAGNNPGAVIHTSRGDITLELFADKAPVTVENFIHYARSGIYAGTVFHRVISHFMIQGGGLTPELQLKPAGEAIVNEADNGLSNTRGTIAMARTTHPHSATAQFFINVQDNLNLNHTGKSSSGAWGYTVFGRVTDGMNVVDDIRFVETETVPPHSDVPKTPVVITGIEIIDPAAG